MKNYIAAFIIILFTLISIKLTCPKSGMTEIDSQYAFDNDTRLIYVKQRWDNRTQYVPYLDNEGYLVRYDIYGNWIVLKDL